MRILHVTHNYPRRPGDAAGAFIGTLARAQRAARHDVHVLAPHADGLALHEEVDGIPVTRFRYAPDAAETLAYTGTMAEQVHASFEGKARLVGLLRAAASATARLRRELRPDVIHAHWWFPVGLALTLPGARGDTPLVTTLHGSDVRLAQGPLARGLMRRVLRASRAVAAVSRWLAAEARGRSRWRVAVAPMPVDRALFRPGGQRLSDRLLFVGRLNAQKGLAVLLAALARLESSIGLDVVGAGPDAAALRELADGLGVAGRVAWHPPVPQPELAAWYRRATALVVPSTAPEGLGLVAAEALLCACPVIASAIGGLTDVVNEATGYPVPPGDVQALAAAVGHCLSSYIDTRTRTVVGINHVLADFDPEVCVARYDELYQDAVRDA